MEESIYEKRERELHALKVKELDAVDATRTRQLALQEQDVASLLATRVTESARNLAQAKADEDLIAHRRFAEERWTKSEAIAERQAVAWERIADALTKIADSK